MLSFKQYQELDESAGRGTIKTKGAESEAHEKKYVTPYLHKDEYSHTLASDHEDTPAGTKVKLIGSRRIDGKLHLHAQDETGKKHFMLASKVFKPGEAPTNLGHNYETSTFERFKKAGITPANATHAGSTSGTDVPILNKRKNTTHLGQINSAENLLSGEVKEGTTAAMGQLTISHHPDKGWHISDKARAKRPKYAAAIEAAGILDHMNKHQDPDKHQIETTSSGLAKTINIKHPDLSPAVSYLQDHHVHVLHVGSGYGTYRVNDSDVTGHGLPAIKGHGRFVIREKQKGNKRARTVAFHPDGAKGLERSHVNLDKDDHLEDFAKTLGHRETPKPIVKPVNKPSIGSGLIDND